ncbi:aminopeptidase [Candidatus Woesearchaeota archaeon]|nr:aminopeptidase [Candidatus Woesearchaeota archaeon]
MVDPRVKKAAEILVNYSTQPKKGEYVVINGEINAAPLIMEVYKLVLKRGAFPITHISIPGMSYNYFKMASEFQLKKFPELSMEETKKASVFINIYGSNNTRELTSINPNKMSIRQKVLEPLKYERLKKRWVLYEFPTDALAQEADMSLEEFEDFVYNATNIDWKKESKKMHKVYNVMSKGNEVRITHNDTDLKFNIKGRKFVIADGSYNMPDGEIFTAPVDNSANGYIQFSFPSIYLGREVDGMRLEFKNGEVVKASAKKNEHLLKSLIKMDQGSKRLGEFGIGLNYNIKKNIKQILFDEKIGGTIHLALGSAYKECNGINKSGLHWDMIKDLRNGGKVYLDGKLVHKNGKWL